MKIKDFLRKHGFTTRWLAEETNVTVSAANKWVQGTRIPRLPKIKIIHQITDGNVSYDDWR